MNLSIYLLSMYLQSIFNWFCALIIFTLPKSSSSEFIPLGRGSLSQEIKRGTDLATFGIIPSCWCHPCPTASGKEKEVSDLRGHKGFPCRATPGACHLSISQGRNRIWGPVSKRALHQTVFINKTSSASIFTTFVLGLPGLVVELASLKEEEWAYLGSLLF